MEANSVTAKQNLCKLQSEKMSAYGEKAML